jgi:hypothetical protein
VQGSPSKVQYCPASALSVCHAEAGIIFPWKIAVVDGHCAITSRQGRKKNKARIKKILFFMLKAASISTGDAAITKIIEKFYAN